MNALGGGCRCDGAKRPIAFTWSMSGTDMSRLRTAQRNTYLVNKKPAPDITAVRRNSRCRLFGGIGDAMTNMQESITSGPIRNTRGRAIMWLSSNMSQSAVPTH